jgi:hypothetical protein
MRSGPPSSKPAAVREKPEVSFDAACVLAAEMLAGETRQAIVQEAAAAGDFARALQQIAGGMRNNAFRAAGRLFTLNRFVPSYDRATRGEGLHVLHDWDGVADEINTDSIPLDVLNFIIGQRASDPLDARVLAIALDYYLLYILALLAMRAWDEGDPNRNLDRVNDLLRLLQGAGGSGQAFSDDAETLLLIATSHFEIDETGYDRLLVRVKTLDEEHRFRVAMGHAHCMGGHLRFGFEVTYARDTSSMRRDNVADYPWLCFALTTLMRAYARLAAAGHRGVDRDRIVEGLIDGLTADAGAFAAAPPESLAVVRDEWDEFHALFRQHRGSLAADAEACRPTEQAYSPIALFFNFSQNLLKGTLVDAMLWGEPWALTLNDLLTGVPRDDPKGPERERLARTLMGYARSNPDPIRGRLMPAIVYDPQTGHRAFAQTLRALK